MISVNVRPAVTHSHKITYLYLAFNSFVILYCLMSNPLDIVNSVKTGIVFLLGLFFNFVFLKPHRVPEKIRNLLKA